MAEVLVVPALHRRLVMEEAIALVDAVRNDPTVPLDDELDALRRVLDRRRLAALTEEQRAVGQC